MNESRDRSAAAPSEDDLARIVAYLDGALADDEVRAFELRLGTEAELARAFEELAATHDELRATFAAAAPDARRDGRGRAAPAARLPAARLPAWFPGAAAAAALALLVGALAWLARAPGASADVRVAVVETAPADADLNLLLGFDADWLPLGMSYRSRAPDTSPQADEYAAALGAALDGHVRAALDVRPSDGPTPAEATSFVLALRSEQDGYGALVVSSAERGHRRVLPRDAPGVRYAAGATHLLPDEPLRLPDDWRTSQRVDYRPGLFTREGVDVTFAWRAEPFTPELVRELDARLAAEGAGLADWFRARGFVVSRLRVEPRDG